MATQLWCDEQGVVLSAELVLVLTVGVLATVVGLHAVATKVVQELNDVACAIGVLDQSYFYNGLQHPGKSRIGGSGFLDARDLCDCKAVLLTVPTLEIPNGLPESGPRPL